MGNVDSIDLKVINFAKEYCVYKTYKDCFITTFYQREKLTRIFGFKVNLMTDLDYTLIFNEDKIFIEKNRIVIAYAEINNRLFHNYDRIRLFVHDYNEYGVIEDLMEYYRNTIYRTTYEDYWYDRG